MSTELLQTGTGPEGSFTCQLCTKPAERLCFYISAHDVSTKTVQQAELFWSLWVCSRTVRVNESFLLSHKQDQHL